MTPRQALDNVFNVGDATPLTGPQRRLFDASIEALEQTVLWFERASKPVQQTPVPPKHESIEKVSPRSLFERVRNGDHRMPAPAAEPGGDSEG